MRFVKALLFIVATTGAAFGQQLSGDAAISLITIGPTQKELYSAFGHSAIRVHDPQNQIDYFFNYGVFSFNQPNFYLNFARGRNMYQLGVYEYSLYRDHYISENRSITEQTLNLTSRQKQQVFDFLMRNALPENKLYLYDYFYDNCATRPRDVLKQVLGEHVRFDASAVQPPITIRQLTDFYLKQQPWGDLGIDICLGMPMDKAALREEFMFLPDSLAAGFSRAIVKNDSVWVPLVGAEIPVFEANLEEIGFSFFHPWVLFSLVGLGLVANAIWDFRRKKLTVWVDKLVFGITGILGLLLVLLWAATDHKAAANNLNVLWALPTNLVLLFRIKMPKYFLAASVLTGVLLISWNFLPQDLHEFLLPLVVGFGSRYWINYKLARA